MKFLLPIFFLLVLIPTSVFAYSSNICTSSSVCTAGEVGVFMKGISKACGNTGDCTLADIMLLFVNTGNYVIALIGGIVLVMYTIGGILFLTSAGNTERITKGKKYLTVSTIGLLIVMFSYLGIYALRGALQYGTFVVTGDMKVCTGGSEGVGDICGLNMTCTSEGLCVSLCEQKYPDATSTTANSTTTLVAQYSCINQPDYATSFLGTPANAQANTAGYWYTSSTCNENLCPGSATTQCCQLNHYEWSTD